jgi:hypothetical protein
LPQIGAGVMKEIFQPGIQVPASSGKIMENHGLK